MIEKIHKDIQTNLRKHNQELLDMNPQEMLSWGYKKFDNQFAITTSFGIQSSVILDMVSKLCLQKKSKYFGLIQVTFPQKHTITLKNLLIIYP